MEILWSYMRGGLYRVALHQSALYDRHLLDISHNLLYVVSLIQKVNVLLMLNELAYWDICRTFTFIV